MAAASALAVGLPVAGLLSRQPEPRPPGPAATQTTLPAPTTVPATPDHPSGRFTPTWLPGSLRVQTEREATASTPDGAEGWYRIYARQGRLPGDQDALTLSLHTNAPPLDVDAEAARYAGARRMEVQGHPALYLPVVAARGESSLAWSPGAGQVAQVRGSGLGEAELSAVAEGFRLPPNLDATARPEGFYEVVRRDGQPFPPATPRRHDAGTAPARAAATNPATRPAVVRISAVWGAPLPAGEPAGRVRGHPAVVSAAENEVTLDWVERPGLLVSVTGGNVSIEGVRRIASGLREQSMAEILRRPTGEPEVVARGDLAGTPYELRARGGASGPCLELHRGSLASICSSDPTSTVAELGISHGRGVVFGPVVPEATSVRLELADGRTVQTDALGRSTGLGAAFYVVALPPETRVVAVVALAAGGEVLRSMPVS